MTDIKQREMRRSDRQLPREEAVRILREATHGILCCSTNDGQPYATPVSHVYFEGALYFHCAKTGLRTDILRENPRICFTAVGSDAPCIKNETNFTTNYESAIAFGSAHIVTRPEEKRRALLALCEKFFPERMERAAASADQAMDATEIWQIEIDSVTGKSNL